MLASSGATIGRTVQIERLNAKSLLINSVDPDQNVNVGHRRTHTHCAGRAAGSPNNNNNDTRSLEPIATWPPSLCRSNILLSTVISVSSAHRHYWPAVGCTFHASRNVVSTALQHDCSSNTLSKLRLLLMNLSRAR